VKMLAKQITGEAVLERNGWTTFKIKFKGYGYGKKNLNRRG